MEVFLGRYAFAGTSRLIPSFPVLFLFLRKVNTMYSLLNLIPFLALLACIEARSTGECVPPEKNFHWRPCSSEATKIKIFAVKAEQGNPPASVDQQGGIDMTSPLVLHINYTNNYRKPIKQHIFDQQIYQYIKEDGRCQWVLIDLNGLLDDMDACTLIREPDCAYKNNPTYTKSVIDFSQMIGDSTSGLEVGRYYAFEITERDGPTKINCFWLQAKVVKA